jgi:plastocyanin
MRVLGLMIIVAAVLAACGDKYGNNPYGGGTGGHSTTITVSNDRFNPTPDTVSAGQVTFSWSNASHGHNVTWDTGPSTPANSQTMTSGTFAVTLQTGTYTYHCTFHAVSAGMRGTVVVQ